MWLKVVLFATLVALASRIFGFVYFLGPHRVVHKHWPGPCRNVAPITNGAEGIALSSNGLAFMSSGFKLPCATDERVKLSKGRIYLFDFKKPAVDAIELSIEGDVTLRSPHGISMWEDNQGIRIFVVDHIYTEGVDTVEIFQFKEPHTLQHIRTIKSETFASVNDVVATSSDTFYVTNEYSVQNNWLKTVCNLLSINSGNVVYYDGVKGSFTGVSGSILNGITQSSDGKFIFVSHMVGESVLVFRRETNNTLTRLQSIELYAIPDNLFYDPATGDLLASCGIPMGFFNMLDDYDIKCGSHLLRIRPKGIGDNPFLEYDVVELFADDGQLLSGSSSAALYGNKLLLGSVLEKAAYCDIKYIND